MELFCIMTTAAATVETIPWLKLELLSHPAYGPDLAPSDYHTLGPLTNALRGRQFENNREDEDSVHTWLLLWSETFFADDITKFVDRSNKYVKNLGDYVEKWQ